MNWFKIKFNKVKWLINSIRYPITVHDITVIGNAPYQKCAEWYHKLNCTAFSGNVWPDELYPPESNEYIHGGRRIRLMEMLQDRVGERYILRTHNSTMSEDEFEDFWQYSRYGCKYAEKRYIERIMSKNRS